MTPHPEERVARLLQLLPPAPRGWVEAAQELPLVRPDLDRIVARAETDVRFRELLAADPPTALEQEGLAPELVLVEALRRRLSPPSSP